MQFLIPGCMTTTLAAVVTEAIIPVLHQLNRTVEARNSQHPIQAVVQYV